MSCEDQLARYKVLIDTARCFGRTVDRATLIDEILNRSQEVMRAEACTLLLPDAQTGELILHSTDPKLAGLPEPLRVPPGKGIAGAVYQSKQKINIRDARQDQRHYQSIGQKVGFVTRAMLTIPLLDGAECLGVLQALNPRDREVFDDSDEEIFEGFGGLISNALVRLEADRQERELVRSRQELEVAREIQESFLPPRVQKFPFGRVHINYFPASAVGGDFCSVHRVGEHRLLLALGDVTGKGIPAALSMARATAMIKAVVGQLRNDLGTWVTDLNHQLVQDLQGGRFIGMTFMLADAESSSMQVCAAGQFPPLCGDRSGWKQLELKGHLPLGISEGVRYRSVSTPLKPGDYWLLFSDGIPEARNRAGEDFTIARLLENLPTGQTAAPTLEAGIAAWQKFVGGAPAHDDVSVLFLDWRGAQPPASFENQCCPERMCAGREFVERWATYAGYDDVTTGQIVMACDEAATNVWRYAYKQSAGGLTYRAALDENQLIIELEDRAGPAESYEFKGRELSDLRPGGLGTFIMSQVFDDVKYDARPGGTSLILRKKLPPNKAN